LIKAINQEHAKLISQSVKSLKM